MASRTAHVGAVWDLPNGLHFGAGVGAIPDSTAAVYAELGYVRRIAGDLEARIDTQFSYQEAIGDDQLGPTIGSVSTVGVRGSSSWEGAMLRLGLGVTGSNQGVSSFYGTDPSNVDLMQRIFNRANEKALLENLWLRIRASWL